MQAGNKSPIGSRWRLRGPNKNKELPIVEGAPISQETEPSGGTLDAPHEFPGLGHCERQRECPLLVD